MKVKQILGLIAASALMLYLIFFGSKVPGEITPIFSVSDKTPINTKNEIVLGVRKGQDRYWKAVANKLKEKDIKLKVVEYKDVTVLNGYVNDGTIDMNCFQTIEDFNNYMSENNQNLKILTRTTAEPFKLYSSENIDLYDLKEGANILIPQSEYGCSRALYTINQAGLITLTPDKEIFDTSDVLINPLKFSFHKVTEDDAKNLYEKAGLACLDNDLAKKAGISTTTHVVYTEPIKYDGCPFVEVAVVRNEDVEKQQFKEIVAALRTKEIREEIELTYGNIRIAAY